MSGRDSSRGAAKVALIVSDLDGTLIERSGIPVPGAADALTELSTAGVPLVVCTGRGRVVAEVMVQRLGLSPVVLASYHGAVVVDMVRHRVLRHLHVPPAAASAMQWALRERGLDVSSYREGAHGFVTRIIATGGPAAVTTAQTLLDRLRLPGVRIEQPVPGRLDIRHSLATKEAALRFVARWLDVPLLAVAALGDDESDAGMLQAAGRPIAVGDADGPLAGQSAIFVSQSDLADCLRSLLD